MESANGRSNHAGSSVQHPDREEAGIEGKGGGVQSRGKPERPRGSNKQVDVGENKVAALLAVQEGLEGGGEYGGDIGDHPGHPEDFQAYQSKSCTDAGESKKQGGEGQPSGVDSQDRHMEELPSSGGDSPLLPVVDGDHSQAEKTEEGPEEKQAHNCAALILQRFEDAARNG